MLATKIMYRFLIRWLKHDYGQDLVEYVLILAMVVLASAALMVQSGNSISAVWTAGNAAINGRSVVSGQPPKNNDDDR